MDLTDENQKILVGTWTDIMVVRKLMLTLRKLKLSNEHWRMKIIERNEIKSNYIYITQSRITFSSKRKLIHTMKNEKVPFGVIYER